MTGFPAQALVLSACLLVLLTNLPAHADPFFVGVFGRTYKVDPRYPASESKSPKPREAMEALPSDIAKGPGFRPSHEQVLADVEERVWIVSNQLEDELETVVASRKWRHTGGDAKEIEQEITGSLAIGASQAHSPTLQTLYDRHRALNLLVRELRRSMDLPVRTPEAGFSRPKLSPEIEASYRSLNFDPLEAYYSFRRVKAAFRSGEIELLSRVVHYPLTVTAKAKRTIRNRDQLVAAKDTVMDPRIREVAAKSTFETIFARDKGMMLGEGEIWITHGNAGFGLGAITLE
ncbi:MAG: hypothetical protein K0Q80_1927 [Microvirga sp.]|jgi:hypothetical protein|nr:hypothetical protein [Microvirga sp.]